MYEGFSKDDGNVIGDVSNGAGMIDIEEAQESTAAEETLICADCNGNEIILSSEICTNSGNLLWRQKYDKETVMRRTVGMSQMPSMLRDNDRNAVYEKSIKIMIQSFMQKFQKQPVILDVGTGTGLLSLLCVKHGAEFVFGVEMFSTMAEIAEQVICDNNAEEHIMIINAKSSDIEDLPRQPDILVSELLDSALLGEGCIPSHTDAIARLINTDPSGSNNNNNDHNYDSNSSIHTRVIPHSGAVFATLIESIEVKHMHNVRSISLAGPMQRDDGPTSNDFFYPYRNKDKINASTNSGSDQYEQLPPSSSRCMGGFALIPVHWEQIQQRGGGRLLSDARQVLQLSFTGEEAALHSTAAADDMAEMTMKPDKEEEELYGHDNENGDSEQHEQNNDEMTYNNNEDDDDQEHLCHHSNSNSRAAATATSSPPCREGYWYETDITVTSSGTMHGVMLWWKLYLLHPSLDPLRQCTYTTAPTTPREHNWQDHWQQTVFPLPEGGILVTVGDIIRVRASHDTIQIRVTAEKIGTSLSSTVTAASVGVGGASMNLAAEVSVGRNSSSSSYSYSHKDDDDEDNEQAAGTSTSNKRVCKQVMTNDTTNLPTNENILVDTDADAAAAAVAAMEYEEGQCVTNDWTSSNLCDTQQCMCGWHLLYGPERFQCMCDSYRSALYQTALETLVNQATALASTITFTATSDTMQDCNSSQLLSHKQPIIMDMSDGSLLAISAALKLRARAARSTTIHNNNSNKNTTTITGGRYADTMILQHHHQQQQKQQQRYVKVVSQENKIYSRMLFGQLASINALNSDYAVPTREQQHKVKEEEEEWLMLWDGVDYSDIAEYFSNDKRADDNSNNNSEYVENDMVTDDVAIPATEVCSASSLQTIVHDNRTTTIVALISECYYSQLRALPTWQALSFYYQRLALLRQGRLHPQCIVMPQRAVVRAAAIELSQLYVSHGTVGSVCGFDHSALDSKLEGSWYTNMFPYKLASYQKKFLTSPITLYTLDYTIDSNSSINDTVVEGIITQSGRCDCVAIWVDYQLTEHVLLKNCHETAANSGGFDFPSYLTVNLKFFPKPVVVGNLLGSNNRLQCRTLFAPGDNDFTFDFQIV